jgi:hypothetical protein
MEKLITAGRKGAEDDDVEEDGSEATRDTHVHPTGNSMNF